MKRRMEQMKLVIVVSCIISHRTRFGLLGHSNVCRADWTVWSFFFYFYLIVKPSFNTIMSHLRLFHREAGPPFYTNPQSPSGKSLSECSYSDFPKLTHKKSLRGARFLFLAPFLQSCGAQGAVTAAIRLWLLKVGALLTDSTGCSESNCSEPPQSLQSRYSPSSRTCCCPSNPGSL